jgi:glutamate--cysteine ligase
MAATQAGRDLEPLRSKDELLEPIYSAFKPAEEFRIGAEAEKFGVAESSLVPVPYEGTRGVVSVMRALTSRFGWREVDVDPLLSLEKNGASVTLEPGAQLELSGAPLHDLHAISRELDEHLAELAAISDSLRAETGEGIAWLGLGFHPFATQDDLPWVPKLRYRFMREYLPTRGKNGLDMMRRTSTVQANFDYSDEATAMRALRVSMKMSPFFTAIFANSPFYEGRRFGGKSYRAKVWLDVDPSRQGLVEPIFRPGAGIADYIEWVLDAPMFLFVRDGEPVANTGQTFRDFFANGFQGHRATYGDWVTHLNSMFPEVRLKRTLEVRGGDSLGRADVLGPAALFTGILYDGRALDQAEEVVGSFGFAELDALRPHVAQAGLAATFRGRPAGEVAAKLLDIAAGGLQRRSRTRADGADESVYLTPAIGRVGSLRSPADDLSDAVAALVATGVEETAAVRSVVVSQARL